MNLNELHLENSTFFITGASGLVGSTIVKYLLEKSDSIVVYALVRNEEKAKKTFADYISERLRFVVSDVTEICVENLDIDYIIHGASQTSSKEFVCHPVETINTAINGTIRVLELAKANPVKSFVYLSSMEVYGTPLTDEKIFENHYTNLDSMAVRTCYPESKRMCENLCTSYFTEYGVPTKIIRLTQTFGSGVDYNDSRVFAEFARCVIEKKNIILKTKGETKRNYLCVHDAVSAILFVLVKGENGNAYNAANEKTYCSIFEMAKLVAEKCADSCISVVIEENNDITKFGYAPTLKMNLSTEKLEKLGWKPEYDLESMFKMMIQNMKKDL